MSKAARTKQAHHGGPTACTNHYTRSVQQLEGVVEERLQQLSLLVAENSLLRRREAALQSAVSSLAGSVSAATQAVMVTSAADPAAALRTTARAQPSDIRCSISDHKKFLLRMQQREAAVQRIMGQLDCGGESQVELYSSWLLHRAFASPERASAHLAMSKADRVAFVLATVQKLGLLVGKYDLLHHPATAMGTPREQLDRLVDELNERTLTFCLLAPPHRQLEMACLNMETGLPEPYPRGWWAVVIDAMQLSDDQKAALKICWEKVKPIKVALTSKYEALSALLTELQRKQLDQQRQFELQAEHAIDTAINRKAARQQRQQHNQQQQQAFGQQQPPQQQLQQQQELLRQQQLFHQQQQQQELLKQQQLQLIHQQQHQQQADAWVYQPQQQPQAPPLQQQQPQPQRRTSLTDGLPCEHELFQFCRALLGGDIEGMEGVHDPFAPSSDLPALAGTATAAPQVAAAAAAFGGAEGQLGLPAPAAIGTCSTPMLVDALTPAAPGSLQHHLQQQQLQQQQQLGFSHGYAARIAPLQVQQAQHFVKFSPAVAAAAAASDEDLWLQGFAGDRHISPHSGTGAEGLSPTRSGLEVAGSEGQGPSASNGSGPVAQEADGAEGMLVEREQEEDAETPPEDSSQQRPSSGSTDPAGGPADSTGALDSTSGPTASKSSFTPSSLSPSQPGHAVSAAAIATAAALAAAAEVIAGDIGGMRIPGSSRVLDVCWQQQLVPTGGFPGDLQGQGGAGAAGMGGVQELGGGAQQPLVLQSSGREQRKLERQMDRLTAQLKMQQYCMHTYVLNICSKKQIALKYVNCFPWVPESFSMCEALDEMGW